MRASLIFLLLLFAATAASAACVTDDTGTEVCLQKRPGRAVSLYGAFTEILDGLGQAGSIVARTSNDTTVEALADLPLVGSGLRPNVEYLLALRPDVILARGGRAGADSLEAMRARGLNVAAFYPQSLDELYCVIERIGKLWEREEAAAELERRIRNGLQAVRAKAAKALQRPSVVFEVRADPLTIAGEKSVVTELIETAGGENASTHPKKLVRLDVEALLIMNPDFYIVQTGPMNANPVELAQRPHHSTLDAVKAGRTAVVDETLFSRPGPNVVRAAEILLDMLHPELATSKQR